MMTNARKQAHERVERWIDMCRRWHASAVRYLLATAEELYEEGEMTRAEYRIAIYELTMMEENK